ncbi:MAG: GNAT family N-acetyltransferase [Saprospiraceae bacterium]|nr:GNAT family N-acetyltransferase [Saprospiraceae bacterium]
MPQIQFNSFPNLQTERLILRPLRQEDLDSLFKLHSDKKNARFIDRDIPENSKETLLFLEKIQKGIAENQWLFWAIEEKEQSLFLGTICIWNFSAHGLKAEVGFELAASFQRKGYMTEALQAVQEYGFEKLGLHRLEARTHSQNAAAIHLLEETGFEYRETNLETSNKTGSAEPITIFSQTNKSL